MYAIPTGNEHYKPTILSVSQKTSELKRSIAVQPKTANGKKDDANETND